MCLAFFAEVFDQCAGDQAMIQDIVSPDMCLAFMNKRYDLRWSGIDPGSSEQDLGLRGLRNAQVHVGTS